jgi:hypothetical protein
MIIKHPPRENCCDCNITRWLTCYVDGTMDCVLWQLLSNSGDHFKHFISNIL